MLSASIWFVVDLARELDKLHESRRIESENSERPSARVWRRIGLRRLCTRGELRPHRTTRRQRVRCVSSEIVKCLQCNQHRRVVCFFFVCFFFSLFLRHDTRRLTLKLLLLLLLLLQLLWVLLLLLLRLLLLLLLLLLCNERRWRTHCLHRTHLRRTYENTKQFVTTNRDTHAYSYQYCCSHWRQAMSPIVMINSQITSTNKTKIVFRFAIFRLA